MLPIIHASRILLGLLFLVFGMNGFYTFIPVPEYHPFMEILVSSGYIYLVKSAEVVCGILLLSNRFVPLALVVLGFDIINITTYHLLLDPRNVWIVPILWCLLLVLIFGYRTYFFELFSFRAKPDLK